MKLALSLDGRNKEDKGRVKGEVNKGL